MFGTRMFDYRDGGEYYDEPGMESGVAEDFSDGYYDDSSAYGDDEAQAWPSSAGPVAADDSPTMPEPTVSRSRKRDANTPKNTAKQDTLVLDRVVEGPYMLPPLSLLVAGDPPKKRSAANDQMAEAISVGAAAVQGRRRGHRLHPRADGHPLRGRTGPRRQGREDHRAADATSPTRWPPRASGCWRRSRASPPSASRCPTPTAKWCAWPTCSPRRRPVATTIRW